MKKHDTVQKRDSFGSQLGMVMAAVGSAVGLGNIWRFSYMVGVNGGGAFLLVYLFCVLIVGIPILIAELTIGRSVRLSTVTAFKRLAPGTCWWITGILSVAAPTLILAYYPVVAGWSLGYVVESLLSWGPITSDPGAVFGAFISGWKAPVCAVAALAVTAAIALGGVSSGIERWNKILMPVLGVILLILVVRSVTLPGAVRGIRFLFVPDFSSLSVGGVLEALGHSFYSLSLGMGIMITYASYMKEDADLVRTTASVVTLDTIIALLAGLAIFPAVFALGMDPAEGAGLAFVTLPGAFAHMPGGPLFSALFFLLLFIAALTSMMSLMQVPLAFLQDELKLSRKRGILVILALLAILGTPSVLAFGPMSGVLIMGKNYFDFLDFLANNILLPITGLLSALFISIHFGVAASQKEFLKGAKSKRSLLSSLYPFAIRFIAPGAILLILLHAVGVFSLLGAK